MDGSVVSLSHAVRPVTLQTFLTQAKFDRRELYWRSGRNADAGPAGITVEDGDTLSFDTYFNSFFESQWRRHTTLGQLSVDVELEGKATLRIHRRALGRKVLIHQQLASSGTTTVAIQDCSVNFRQHGVLSIELAAQHGRVTLRRAAWIGEVPGRPQAGLAAVFCTLNRERELADCLDALATHQGLAGQLARVIVVNQGSPGLRHVPALADAAARLGSKLLVIDQPNKGGAGGFTRGLLAALDDPAVTHAVLLDDDIEIEPGSLARMAEFFAAAKQDIVLGGHMLDSLNPTTLYEAGAVITEQHWVFRPKHHGLNIGSPEHLEGLSHPSAVHYNGWWCCGLPLSLLRKHGLPLPCFIRGDDVELGLRLGKLGVATVPMPGIAVWHEPFYLKLGSWQLYYETRNMLVSASLHMPATRLGLLRRIGRQVVQAMLTYRYYNAALILDGVRDFLTGPDIMQGDPLPLHRALAERRDEFVPLVTPRTQVLETQQHGPVPRTATACLMLMVRLMARNALVRSASGPPRSLPVSDISWIGMAEVDNVALETWWDDGKPTLRRSREHHRRLLRRAVPLLLRLFRDGPAAAQAWREATPRLTSMRFWRSYLDLPQLGSSPVQGLSAAEANRP